MSLCERVTFRTNVYVEILWILVEWQHRVSAGLDFHKTAGAELTGLALPTEPHALPNNERAYRNLAKGVVTRVMEIQSVLALFDKETRSKIALSVFKTPLYQSRNRARRDCLSTDLDTSKLPVTADGQWVNYEPIGTALTVP